eukprot:SAG11_NODE_20878_length_436_cov_1.353116_1_plen_25_part_01
MYALGHLIYIIMSFWRQDLITDLQF